MWVVEQPVPVVVSPKVQEHVKAPVPPVGLAVNDTDTPASVGFGLAVGAATVGAALTVTVTAGEVAVWAPESVTNTVALKDPAAAYL